MNRILAPLAVFFAFALNAATVAKLEFSDRMNMSFTDEVVNLKGAKR